MQNGSDAGVYAQFFDGCASTRPTAVDAEAYAAARSPVLVIEVLGTSSTRSPTQLDFGLGVK